MLPVVAGAMSTRRHILAYSFILFAFSLLPAFTPMSGWLYLVASFAAGIVFLKLAIDVYRIREGREADKRAKRLFLYSIFYLFFLFLVMLVEAMVPGALLPTGFALKV